MSSKNKPPRGIRSVISTTENPPMPPVAIEIEGYSVSSWRPSVDDSAPCEQVHFAIQLKGVPPLVLRIKSRRAMDELISTLNMHADEVWPE